MAKKVPWRTRVKRKIKKNIKEFCKYIGFKMIYPSIYKRKARKPIDSKLVVFADLRDRDMPDNFIGIYNMCKENGCNCIFLSGSMYGENVPQKSKVKAKIKYQITFMKLFAKCRALFLVEYFPLAYLVKPRKETDVIQLWHGCGLMKRMGYAVTSTKWGQSEKQMKRYPMHTSYSLVCTTSPRVRDGFIEAFRCNPEVVKNIGSPRTDIYFDKEFKFNALNKVRELIPNIKGKKIILYAPTFRGQSIPKSYLDSPIDYFLLKTQLSEDFVVLTKFHPLMAGIGLTETQRLRAKGFVYDVTDLLTPEEALCSADILISDYSSIMFEYLLLERPVISFIYDLDTYISDRGLFAPYDQLAPGPYVFDQDELTKAILTVDEWFDVERIREYKNKFMSACDGHSTERIYKYFFETGTKNDNKTEELT